MIRPGLMAGNGQTLRRRRGVAWPSVSEPPSIQPTL